MPAYQSGTFDEESYFELDEGIKEKKEQKEKNVVSSPIAKVLEKAKIYSQMLKKYPFKVTFEDSLPSNILTPVLTTTNSTSTARLTKNNEKSSVKSLVGTVEKQRAGSSNGKNSGGTGSLLNENDLLHSSSLKKKRVAKKSKKLYKNSADLSFFPPIPQFETSDDDKENKNCQKPKKTPHRSRLNAERENVGLINQNFALEQPRRENSYENGYEDGFQRGLQSNRWNQPQYSLGRNVFNTEFQFPTQNEFEDSNMERLRLKALLRQSSPLSLPLSIADILIRYPDYLQRASGPILQELGRQISSSIIPEEQVYETRPKIQSFHMEPEKSKPQEHQPMEQEQRVLEKKASRCKILKRAPFFKTSGLDQMSFSLPATHQELLSIINKTHPAFLNLAKGLLETKPNNIKTENLCEAFLKAMEKRRDLILQKIIRLNGLGRNAFHELRKKSQLELNISKQNLKECNQLIHRLESTISNLEHGAANPGTTALLNQMHILHQIFEN